MDTVLIVIAALTPITILIGFIVICAIKDYKKVGENKEEHKEDEASQTHSSNNPIEAMIEEVSPILLRLLRGFSKPDKEDYDRITIECRIFVLNYFRFFIEGSFIELVKEYESAFMKTYQKAVKYGFTTIEQFSDYFSKRFVQYIHLHYSILQKKQEGEKGVPLEYMGFRFLICGVPLKSVTDEYIQQNISELDNDPFVLLMSSQNIMEACNYINFKCAEYKDDDSFLIEDILSELPYILLDGSNIDDNNSFNKSLIECRIFGLHYLIMLKNKMDDELIKLYDDSLIETYCQIQDILPMDERQFADYFKKRCHQYTYLHNKMVDKMMRFQSHIPAEVKGLKYLLWTVPLKDIDYNEILQSESLVDDDSTLISFSLNVTKAYRLIFEKISTRG